MIVQLVQVYLVTGGSPLSSAGDTTELLVHGDSSWTSSGRLPTPRTRLRGATINNKIVVTGKDVTWSSRANQFYALIHNFVFFIWKRLNLSIFFQGVRMIMESSPIMKMSWSSMMSMVFGTTSEK